MGPVCTVEHEAVAQQDEKMAAVLETLKADYGKLVESATSASSDSSGAPLPPMLHLAVSRTSTVLNATHQI